MTHTVHLNNFNSLGINFEIFVPGVHVISLTHMLSLIFEFFPFAVVFVFLQILLLLLFKEILSVMSLNLVCESCITITDGNSANAFLSHHHSHF